MMAPRSFPKHLLFVALLALAMSLFATGAAAQPRNILLIVADDIGIDKMRMYYPDPTNAPDTVAVTPTLDTLAATGVRFANAWANPVCSTTRATIQTGRFSFRTGIGGALGPTSPIDLSDDAWTLPKMLPESYTSAAFGKWHLTAEARAPFSPGNPRLDAPLDAGYDFFQGTMANLGRFTYWDPSVIPEENYSTYWQVTADPSLEPMGSPPVHAIIGERLDGHATVDTVTNAIGWLQTAPEPWFAYVALHAPHDPLHSVPGYPGDLTAAPCPDDLNRPEWLECHRDMVSIMDAEIGRLLAALNQPGIEPPTIIFVGDNGTDGRAIESPPYPLNHSKTTIFEGGIRVPLLISDRDVTSPGRTVDATVTTSDLFATIAQLAEVGDLVPPNGETLDTCGLQPHLRADFPDAPTRGWGYGEIFIDNERRDIDRVAIWDGRFKLIRDRSEDPGSGRTTPPVDPECPPPGSEFCLYDLAVDIGEQDNLIGLGIPEEDVLRDLLASLEQGGGFDGGCDPG